MALNYITNEMSCDRFSLKYSAVTVFVTMAASDTVCITVTKGLQPDSQTMLFWVFLMYSSYEPIAELEVNCVWKPMAQKQLFNINQQTYVYC